MERTLIQIALLTLVMIALIIAGRPRATP